MLKLSITFMLFMLLSLSGLLGQTKVPGTYRSGMGDGIYLSDIYFSVGKISGDSIICLSSDASWGVRVSGVSLYAYQWMKNGVPLSGKDSSVLEIKGVALSDAGRYFCRVTDILLGSYKDSDPVDVKVKEAPDRLSVSASLSKIAKGDSLTLTASNAPEYKWSTGESASSIIVSPARTTTYTVTGTTDGICPVSKSVIVEVVEVLLNAGVDQYTTAGSVVRLRARTNLPDVKWYSLDVTRSRTLVGSGETVTVSPSVTTVYEAEALFNGTAVNSSVKVNVRMDNIYHSGFQDGICQSPVSFNVSKIVGDTTVCNTDTTTLAVSVQGISVYGYQWKKLGTPSDALVGIDSNILILRGVVPVVSGKYFCEVTDLVSGAVKNSDTLDLQVVLLPDARIGFPADSTILCYGDSITLDARDSEIGKLPDLEYTYSWSGVSGKTDTSVIKICGTSSRPYIVGVTDRGCTAYDTVTVLVSHPQVSLPDVYNTSEGGTISLQASCSDNGDLTWSVDGNAFPVQPSSRPFVYGPVTGPVVIRAKMSLNGCSGEDSCQVRMKVGGSYRSGLQDGNAQSCIRLQILGQSDKEIAGCATDSIQLFVDVEGSAPTYIWQKLVDHQFVTYVPAPGSHVVGLNTSLLKFKPPVVADEGLYRCVIRNECGEVVSDTFGVSVGGRPVFVTKLNRDWEQCLHGISAELAVYAVSLNNKLLTYKWYKDGVLFSGEGYDKSGLTIPMDRLDRAGQYHVEVSNECGKISDTTYLPVSIPAYVEYCDTVVHVCEGGTADFKVKISGGGVYTSSLKRVVFNTPNPMDYNLVDIGKTGQQVQLTGLDMSHNGEYYAWEVSNHCGGDTSRLIRLAVERRPELLPLGNDTSLCEGGVLRLQCRLKAGSGTIDYKWYKNGVYTGVTGSVYTKTVTSDDAGVYVCRVGNAYCSIGAESSPVLVTVKKKASISNKGIYAESAVINAEGKYCEGTDLTLKANIPSGQELDSIRWFLNGRRVFDIPGRVVGSNTSSLILDSVTPQVEGNYTLHLYNSCGENISSSYNLTVPVPARFVKDGGNLLDMTLCQGVNQSISVKATGTAPIRFTWTHGNRTIADGYSNTIQLTGVTVDTAGIYCCEIHNGCNPAQRECADIRVVHPDTFRLVGSGRYCMNSTDGAPITLNGSDTSTFYRLYKNGTIVNTIHGKDVVPMGGPVIFEKNFAGTYYVTGENSKDHCEFRMPGDVVIQGDIAPVVYTLSLTQAYCIGSSGAILTLSGSEENPDIRYTLYRVTVRGDVLESSGISGTGKELKWSGLKDGDYRVVAENTISGCRSDMTGIVNVTRRPLPLEYELIAKDNKTTYCEGMDSEVELSMTGSEKDISYVLLVNHLRPGSISATPKWTGVKSGVYSVYAVNIWGCETTESNTVTVTERPAPKMTLTGSDVYCTGDTSKHRILLNDLKNNVEYTVYRETPKEKYAFFSGASGSLGIDVPSEEKDYYVEAVEQPGKCEYTSPKVSIKKSSFTISAPGEVTIGNGSQATLTVTVSGATKPTITWSPSVKLDGPSNTATVKTTVLQNGETYTVTVKDGSCQLQTLVKVTVTGIPLVAEVRLDDQLTGIDTLRVCNNEKLSLYGWHDGGTGSYTHTWYDGIALAGSTALLKDYEKKSSGYLRYEVKSGEVTRKDSVYIYLLPAPKVLSLADSGLVCTSVADYTIRLKPRTETDVWYVLEYDRTGSGTYEEFTDTKQPGYGGSLNFTIKDADQLTGHYRIKATRLYPSGEECTSLISAVELRTAPRIYTVTGSSVYCAGERVQDTVTLSASQPSVSYSLLRKPSTILVSSLSGSTTGGNLRFTGQYGSGTYIVKGKLGSCEVTMKDSALIKVNTKPSVRQMTGTGSYCFGKDKLPVKIGVPNGETGVTYTLYRKYKSIVYEEGVKTGPGNIDFGNYDAIGEYFIGAVGKDNSCELILEGRVFIGNPPVNFHIDGDNAYPVGGPVAKADLRAYNIVQPGVPYKLYNIRGAYVGLLSDFKNEAYYYRDTLSKGRYVVKAEVGSCSYQSKDTVTISEILVPYNITGDTLFCDVSAASGARIGIDSTQKGIKYILQQETSGGTFSDAYPRDTLRGSGFPERFFHLHKAGIYRVLAFDTLSEMTLEMNGLLEVKKKPGPDWQMPIELTGNVCVDSIVDIRFVTEPSVIYKLYHNAALTTLDTLKGDGSKQGWTLSPAELGTYKIKGFHSECPVVFPLDIRAGHYPLVGELMGDIEICSNKTGELWLDNYEAGIIYSRYSILGGNAIDTGQVVRGVYTYDSVRPGTYYVVGSDGLCLNRSNSYTLGAIPATDYPSGFALNYSACVIPDSGWIELSGMIASQQYILQNPSLVSPLDTVYDYNGTKKYEKLALGKYCLTITDKGSLCPTLDSCVTLKSIAPMDTIVGDIVYCDDSPGVSFRLSAVTANSAYILYKLGDKKPLAVLAAGSKVFPGPYSAGTYALKKESKGLFPGCVDYDTLTVTHRAGVPDKEIGISVEGSRTLCSSDSLFIRLNTSETGVSYHMRQIEGNNYTVRNTVAGTGSSVRFSKHAYPSGYYRIYAEYTGGGCGRYLDTLLQIQAIPDTITLTGCEDCLSLGVSTGGCAIEAKGMTKEVRYILHDNSGSQPLDTLLGPGTKHFALRPAGNYYVIAEHTGTGCRDTMPTRPSIKTLPAPLLYNVNKECAVKASVVVSGSDGDSVLYTLYRNKLSLLEDTLRGTGNPFSFPEKNIPGIYKVWAEHRNGCGLWMRDSVTVYNELDTCHLRQEGDFCAGSTKAPAIYYDCAVAGWNYYLKRYNLSIYSDTIKGEMNRISWDTVGGQPILTGTYELYAYNNCKKTYVTSLKVDMKNLPRRQPILTDAIYCGNAGFDLVMGDSESGVIYRLAIVNSNGTEQTLLSDTVKRGGVPVTFKPAKGGHFVTAGRYRIYGKYIGASCESVVAEQVFLSGTVPAVRHLEGSDVCIQNGLDSIVLSISGREQNVNYYLQRMTSDTVAVDSLTGLHNPPPNLRFSTQKTIGCYTGYGQHITSGCRSLFPEVYCLGNPPSSYPVENPGDTVRLCSGDSTWLYLNNSDAGVKYYVLRDGIVVSEAYYGPGRLKTMALKESGIYKIKAVNGCTVMMADSLIVHTRPVPSLPIDTTRYHYCEGGDGVPFEIPSPTPAYVKYTLTRPDGIVDETLMGIGGKLTFTNKQTLKGNYELRAEDTHTGCTTVDTVRMRIDTLPTPFALYGDPGNYICWGENGKIRLSGSTENARYMLYCNDLEVSEQFGTGKELIFDQLKNTGTYLVVATFSGQPGCSSSMQNTVVLQKADSIRRYQLTSSGTSYCHTDTRKGTVTLQSSDYGVEYELYKDGKATGVKQPGNGGPLSWTRLEGKPCAQCVNDADGYDYHVVGRNVTTNCVMPMKGSYKIIEESDVKVSWFHPNKDIYVCQDSSVDFTVVAEGCKLYYRWYHEDRGGVVRMIKSSGDPYYKLQSAQELNYGRYWCEINNTCARGAQTVAVEVKVRRKMELKPDRNVSICDGSTQTVRLEAIYYGTTYRWYRSGRPDSVIGTKQVLEIKDAASSHAGQYICEAANECYTLRDTCLLQIGVPPTVQITKERTDTLCRGSEYKLSVNSPDRVEWFLNGTTTGLSGLTYHLPAVTPSDAGHYSVKVTSGCGMKWQDVGDLFVDDTIKVLDMTEDKYILCGGKMLNLFVQTSPSERVNYTWEYLGDAPQVIGRESRISYGPLASSNTAYTFRVWFTNKCIVTDPANPSASGSYRQIRVQVNEKANVEDPPKEIIVCADPAQDTVIRLVHDNKLGMLYSWHFYDYKNDTVPGVSDADTVSIPLQTKNSGYYFCRVNNGCEIIATNACWVRIDSVPVIKSSFSDADTLCEGGSLKMDLSATGGSLNYDWTILYKDGSTEIIGKNFLTDFESTGSLALTPLAMKHDSALIWCHVHNHCDMGGSYSDTMLLRIHPFRQITLTPDSLQICGNEQEEAYITLTTGDLPWRYSYRIVGETAVIESGWLNTRTDTLHVSKAGRYKILEVEDTTHCRRISDLPILTVESIVQSELSFSGGGTRCTGDTVSVRFHVNGGIGPWEMTVMREKGGEADEILPDGLLQLYGRDTTITFTVQDSQTYYIYGSMTDLGSGCLSKECTDRVKVHVNDPGHIDFRTGWPAYVGQCHLINLRDSLKPKLNGKDVTEGGFYVNDKSLNGDQWLAKDLRSGCHKIKYSYKDPNGCEVTSDEIQMCVDSLPWARIVLPENSCEGVAEELKIELSPRTQHYTLKFYQHRVRKNPGKTRSDFRTVQVAASSGGKYSEPLSWSIMPNPGNPLLSEIDSCMMYDIVGITDSHGCAGIMNDQVRDTLYRDTVMLRLNPEFDIKTRYPHDANWISTSFAINIIRGDSVDVRATLTRGYPLWSLVAVTPPTPSSWPRIYNVPDKDTTFSLKAEGMYEFKVRDEVCEKEFGLSTVEVHILDTAYIRARLLLEGPYNSLSRKMQSSISPELLASYGLSGWPSTVSPVIDYVIVELRGDSLDPKTLTPLTTNRDVARLANGAELVAVDTCLLLANGQLANRHTGDTVLSIPNVCRTLNDKYYVAVRHRNHIGVMTDSAHYFRTDRLSCVNIDFTDSATIYCRTLNLENHMSRHGKIWMLSAGELNENSLISVFDPNKITIEETGMPAQNGYDLLHDVNFDGKVDWPMWNGSLNSQDWDRVRRNRTKYSELRWRLSVVNTLPESEGGDAVLFSNGATSDTLRIGETVRLYSRKSTKGRSASVSGETYQWYSRTDGSPKWTAIAGQTGKDASFVFLKDELTENKKIYFCRKTFFSDRILRSPEVCVLYAGLSFTLSDTVVQLGANGLALDDIKVTAYPKDGSLEWLYGDKVIATGATYKARLADFGAGISGESVRVKCVCKNLGYTGEGKEIKVLMMNAIASDSLDMTKCGTYKMIDKRDGQRYRTVKIGGQCWMAENMTVGKQFTGSFKNTYNVPGIQYGMFYFGGLYSWEETVNGENVGMGNYKYSPNGKDIQGICPDGWHVPSDEEWKTLEMSLGMTRDQADATDWRGTDQGCRIKSTEHWNDGGEIANGTNTSGLDLYPGGQYSDPGEGTRMYARGYFWSSTLSGPYGVFRELNYDKATVYRGQNGYNGFSLVGYSVRCVRDIKTGGEIVCANGLALDTVCPEGKKQIFSKSLPDVQEGETVRYEWYQRSDNKDWKKMDGHENADLNWNASLISATNSDIRYDFYRKAVFSGGELNSSEVSLFIPATGFSLSTRNVRLRMEDGVGEEIRTSGAPLGSQLEWKYNGTLLKTGTSYKVDFNDFGIPADTRGDLNVTCTLERFGCINTVTAVVTVADWQGTVTDKDGNVYPVVKIGEQYWMAKNLNVGIRVDGSDYNTHNIAGIQKICYDNSGNYCALYGGLYSWDEAVNGGNAGSIKYTPGSTTRIQGICPDGWHLPSDAEWTVLTDFLGEENVAGGKMKGLDALYWDRNNPDITNSTGFSGLSGGYRNSSGGFIALGSNVYFWSTTEYSSSNAWLLGLGSSYTFVHRSYNYGKSYGLSVRCLRD